MAIKQDKIQDTENSNFGNYKESTGGGKPFNTSNTRTTRANGKYRQANNDSSQPRTDDGKFTYRSVNGKSIDPKYGPSRGKTVNPLLTGGVNGIKIEDVEKQFSEEKGTYWDKYKDKWYRKGGTAILGRDHKTRIAGESIWEIARQRYDEVKKEFGGKIEWDSVNKEWVDTGKGGESETWSEVKKGRKSQEEKKAATEAYKSNKQTFVTDTKSGGIKLAPNAQKVFAQQPKQLYRPMFTSRVAAGSTSNKPWRPKMATPTQTTSQYNAFNAAQSAPAPVQPGSSTVQVTGKQQVPQSQLKHTKAEFDQLRKDLVASGTISQADLNNFDDAFLDEHWSEIVA